ncbi:hypothetical protein [Nocardia abscessus]|uniref:hypothetical protein n=1 Tax=Nocardia abscessus TaxID=120957 RepID=UPI002454FF0E|nr:hypothetical protein [Nocardia abscessus]
MRVAPDPRPARAARSGAPPRDDPADRTTHWRAAAGPRRIVGKAPSIPGAGSLAARGPDRSTIMHKEN